MVVKLYIYISLDDEEKYTVYEGEAVYLYVNISYPDVLEDLYHNEDVDEEIKRLKDRFEKEEISEEEYNKLVEELESKKVDIETVKVGDEANPWASSLEIRMKMSGSWAKCPWEFREAYRDPPGNVVEFSGGASATVIYALGPDDVSNISVGEYSLMVVLDESSSNEVVLRRMEGVREEFDENVVEKTARYHINFGDYKRARMLIDGILRADPSSISGLILLADYQRSEGKLEDAVQTLLKAREVFHERYPDSPEPPWIIEMKLAELMASLRKEESL
jgi:tetratricopeptide (TPR) repeat protein